MEDLRYLLVELQPSVRGESSSPLDNFAQQSTYESMGSHAHAKVMRVFFVCNRCGSYTQGVEALRQLQVECLRARPQQSNLLRRGFFRSRKQNTTRGCSSFCVRKHDKTCGVSSCLNENTIKQMVFSSRLNENTLHKHFTQALETSTL